jgi:NADH dehydrogenase
VLCTGSHRAEPLRGGADHGVDTYEEALVLREALAALEPQRPRLAVVGAGFTGIELAAELALEAEVHLISAGPAIAPDFGPRARPLITQALHELGVRTHVGCPVERSDAGGVTLADGRRIGAEITVWATGPRASALLKQLNVDLDGLGRIRVDQHLAAPVDGVWVAGDGARVSVDGIHDAVMSCQHAMPQGRRAGANAVRVALGRKPRSYRQPLYSTCLDLGAAGALMATGFDRNHVASFGPEAKRVKRFINRSLIYPPTGDGARPLLKLGASGTPGPALAAIQLRALRSATIRRLVTMSAPDRAALQAA